MGRLAYDNKQFRADRPQAGGYTTLLILNHESIRFYSRIRSRQLVTHLLLLHGTGGNERDLIPLGRELDPNAALLSPRGKVLENGMPRFFRRLAEGVFDLEDLKYRTNELADFVTAAAQHYGFATDQLVAVGYSNGANIAASMLLLGRKLCIGQFYFARWCR